ncbi:MAG: germination protein YpeB [Clostridia bacterium]|nr:germination protein YpeB [Clostridia bacterium]
MAQTKTRTRNKANIGLIIALCIVSGLLIVTSIMLLSNMQKANGMGLTIESVYSRNFYDLMDNVNNSEVKMSKVLASNYDLYARKLLGEISKNAYSASYNLSNLPISLNGIDETKKFINQVSGYTGYLCDKIDRGEKLTTAEIDTLESIYESLAILKNNLSQFNEDYIAQGFNIFNNGNLIDGDYNNFTQKIQGIKASDVEYPTMIYDGPFADSTLNKEVKGLNGSMVAVDYAKQEIKKLYADISDEDITFKGEATGMFDTFDFEVNLADYSTVYVQITKIGGKLLTVSGYGDQKGEAMTLSNAVSKAKEIAQKQTGVTLDCVWSDVVGQDAYLNLAPVQNQIVLYPDLIKVKIDLATGNLIGYSASGFYTNHTNRTLGSASFAKAEADAMIPQGFKVEMSRLCLAPLDVMEEKLCYEYMCGKDGSTYYIYINAQNGITENILKVIETNDGNKLM